jgi:hypothetical protein
LPSALLRYLYWQFPTSIQVENADRYSGFVQLLLSVCFVGDERSCVVRSTDYRGYILVEPNYNSRIARCTYGVHFVNSIFSLVRDQGLMSCSSSDIQYRSQSPDETFAPSGNPVWQAHQGSFIVTLPALLSSPTRWEIKRKAQCRPEETAESQNNTNWHVNSQPFLDI